jgi:DNA gyrase/topoisomerase IV subunit B
MVGVAKMRDPDKHAVLPLKGKIINAEKSTIDALMKNSETKDIITALGCGIYPHCDLTKLKYDKIIIAADADPDGAHITALLITLFAKITPDIIKSGKLFICEAPLYGSGLGKNFIPLWNEDDLNNAKNNNKKIDRYKGLGSYGNVELSQVILNPSTRKLTQIEWTKNVNRVLDLMSGPADERKKLAFGKWEI